MFRFTSNCYKLLYFYLKIFPFLDLKKKELIPYISVYNYWSNAARVIQRENCRTQEIL